MGGWELENVACVLNSLRGFASRPSSKRGTILDAVEWLCGIILPLEQEGML